MKIDHSEGKSGVSAAQNSARMIESLENSYRDLEKKLEEVTSLLDQTQSRLEENRAESSKSTHLLDHLLESLSCGIIVSDADGRITQVNPAIRRMTGFSEKEMSGRRHSELFMKTAQSSLPLVVERDTPDSDRELLTKSGARLKINSTSTAITDISGKPAGQIDIIYDRTRLNQLEQEIAQLKTLAAVGEMTAMLAHEIRNPLGGVAGFAELLDKDVPDGDPKKKYVGKIAEGVEMIIQTVNNLLTYARPLELALQSVLVSDFLDRVVELFQSELARSRKEVKVERKYSRPDLTARLDPQRFQQVFLNLLLNSSQGMNKPGKIELWYDLISRDSKPTVHFKVADNGAGIAPEMLKKLFTPFSTSKETGTGLGLATVKKVVEAHRGEVKVSSQAGTGTQVEIWLPQE